MSLINELAETLGGEVGASRPVIDAGWVQKDRQIGASGQTVAPKLYVACGVSGAVQHLSGMKKSEFVVAVNSDVDAPIGEVTDVFAVADLTLLVPALVEKIKETTG
jgi:electron transfer flavoprotein alpha subunit